MSFSPRLLAGRVGVVTGAGSPHGIGRSLVLGLAAAGARAVYATDLTTAHMASLRDEVQASGSHCSVHAEVFDVSSEEQTVAVVKRALADYGRLDFYFANAGMTGFRCVVGRPVLFFLFLFCVPPASSLPAGVRPPPPPCVPPSLRHHPCLCRRKRHTRASLCRKHARMRLR